jgi:hypothetical protein
MVVLSAGVAASSAETAWLAGAICPPVTIAAARAKNLWLMVLAMEVEDKILAATATKPSKSAMRVVRIENERENSVGCFGAIVKLLSVEDRNTCLGRRYRSDGRTPVKAFWVRIVCFD